jgi:hypothetical protein
MDANRVQALDGAIDEDNRELVNTNIGVQTMTVRLTTLAMRERELLEERNGLKQTLNREKAAIQRVKQEYQLRVSAPELSIHCIVLCSILFYSNLLYCTT